MTLSPLSIPATNWPIVPGRIMDEYEAFGGMRMDNENRSTRKKAAPVPFCQIQILHDMTWVRNWVTAVGSRRQTT